LKVVGGGQYLWRLVGFKSNKLAIINEPLSCVQSVRVKLTQVSVLVEAHSSDAVNYRLLYLGVHGDFF
jgi:hypothetical protein